MFFYRELKVILFKLVSAFQERVENKYEICLFLESLVLGFLSFSQPPPPLPKRCNCRGGGMAEAIPPPNVSFALDSSSLLDVPRPDTPHPFSSSPASSIPVFVLVFCRITFMSISMSFFWVFFAVSADFLRAGFTSLYPLLGFFRAPTATSFHRTFLCMGSTYTRSVYFSVFLFACI
jgi:hypothetical protein